MTKPKEQLQKTAIYARDVRKVRKSSPLCVGRVHCISYEVSFQTFYIET